jgi:hypothetical protein
MAVFHLKLLSSWGALDVSRDGRCSLKSCFEMLFRHTGGRFDEKKVSRGALPAEYYGQGHLEIVADARKLLIRIQDLNCDWGTGQALSIFNFCDPRRCPIAGLPVEDNTDVKS